MRVPSGGVGPLGSSGRNCRKSVGSYCLQFLNVFLPDIFGLEGEYLVPVADGVFPHLLPEIN